MSKTIKFGGTSLSCGKNIALAAGIIKKENVNYVVVSAPGKRFKEDKKITDLLLACANSKNKTDRKNAFLAVKSRFSDIKKELGLTVDLEADFSETENAIFSEGEGKTGYFFIVSRGEYITAKAINDFIVKGVFVPAEKLFVFYNGRLDLEKTKTAFSFYLSRIKGNHHVVTSGFYGADENGKICLLPRGGGDLSGAIAAKCLNAKMYVNYTDVGGIKNAPPSYVKNAKTINKISYNNLKILCGQGASVFSKEAADFVCRNKIKTVIKSSFGSDGQTRTIKKRNYPFKALTVTRQNYDYKATDRDVHVIFLAGKSFRSKKFLHSIKTYFKSEFLSDFMCLQKTKNGLKIKVSGEKQASEAIEIIYKKFL